MSVKLSREAYAKKYGPTVGDRIRLADTELIIEIEQDYADYGEESIFGGGKSIRDGQDQCPLEEPMSPKHCDLVITNAVIIDYWGIVKGDIGIKDGPDRGHRQVGQPADAERRRPAAGHRPGHRDHRRRGEDRARPAASTPTSTSSARSRSRSALASRHHHADRRRHRLGHRHLGDDLHARALEHHADAPGVRGAADQRRHSRQGQRQPGQAARGTDRGRGLRTEAPRGLGHHARRSSTPA